MAIIMLILLWFICSRPFMMKGLSAEVSGILGVILGIIVCVCMANGSNGESSQQTTHLPTKRHGSNSSVADDDVDNIDEMVMLDLMDGELDGKFNFFDKD